MFQMEYAVEFKEAAIKLQERIETEKVEWENGICWMLSSDSDLSYEIIDYLLNTTCLRDYGTFTEERELFLEFLAYTLTAEDIYEICVDIWED